MVRSDAPCFSIKFPSAKTGSGEGIRHISKVECGGEAVEYVDGWASEWVGWGRVGGTGGDGKGWGNRWVGGRGGVVMVSGGRWWSVVVVVGGGGGGGGVGVWGVELGTGAGGSRGCQSTPLAWSRTKFKSIRLHWRLLGEHLAHVICEA